MPCLIIIIIIIFNKIKLISMNESGCSAIILDINLGTCVKEGLEETNEKKTKEARMRLL